MKLSQGMKDRITTLVLAAKFDTEETANEIAFNKLADDIYLSFPDISKAAKMPNGWLHSTISLSLNFGGSRVYLDMSERRPMPYKYVNGRIDFDAEHEFTARFRLLTDQQANIVERKKELRQELQSVLNGVNTDKQLLSIWPEAIQWLPSTPIPLPVVTSVDRLKRLMGAK